MTTTAANITDVVKILLNDTSNTHWPLADLYKYINEAQYLVAIFRSDKMASYTSFQLTAGETRHTVPATVLKLLNVQRNMGADGSTQGGSIRRVSKATIDAFDVSWHTETGAIAVTDWFPDPANSSTAFFVYPPVHAVTAVYVEAEVVNYPSVVDESTDNLSVPDEFAPAIVDFVCSRALSEETERIDEEKARAYLTQFVGVLGVEVGTVERAQGGAS